MGQRTAHTTVIILPVFNGEAFLPDLLSSIERQTMSNWHLYASDDGSDDDSKAILSAFQEHHPSRVSVFDGPCDGITANYLSLINRLDPNTPVMTFCDQDDIWLDTRLARITAALIDPNEPTLFCSRTQLVDAQGQPLRLSPARNRPPSFANALCQNIASGNTMAFNQTALSLIQSISQSANSLPFHDWWAYQIITGVGGQIIHDDAPTLMYRQHKANAVGASTGLSGARRRTLRVASSNLSTDMDKHLATLDATKDILTPENAHLLAKVINARRKGALGRLTGIVGTGLYRQTRLGTLGLWASAALGRF